MNYKILNNKTRTKSQIRALIIKWAIYIACMLFFYSIMRSGAFDSWQPVLIIPLAVSVALYERELSSCVFALFSGYLIDISCRYIFGFSAVWLMIVCLAASLMSRNLIKVNFVNFMWINITATVLHSSMSYLFNVFIWDIPNKEIILDRSIIPSAVSTVIISSFVFLFVCFINNRFGDSNSMSRYDPDSNTNEEDTISKN